MKCHLIYDGATQIIRTMLDDISSGGCHHEWKLIHPDNIYFWECEICHEVRDRFHLLNEQIGKIIWIGPRRDIILEGAGRIADLIINGHDERTIEEIAETEHLYHIIPGYEMKWTNICQIIEENDGWAKQINEWLPQLIEFIKQNDKMVSDYRSGNHRSLVGKNVAENIIC